MRAAWLKEEGGLFIFDFCIQMRGGGLIYFLFLYPNEGGGGLIGEGLEEKGAKYINYSTSIPSSPFQNMLQERGQLQGLKPGLQGQYCMLCTW